MRGGTLGTRQLLFRVLLSLDRVASTLWVAVVLWFCIGVARSFVIANGLVEGDFVLDFQPESDKTSAQKTTDRA